MTIEEFQNKNCKNCNSQKCLGNKKDIEYCRYLNENPVDELEYKGIAYHNIYLYNTEVELDITYLNKEENKCDMNYLLDQMIEYQLLNRS